MCDWNKLLDQYNEYLKINVSFQDEFLWLQKEFNSIQDNKDEDWTDLADEAKQFLDILTEDIKYVIELPANQSKRINALVF